MTQNDAMQLLRTARSVAAGQAAFTEAQQRLLARALVEHLSNGADVGKELGLCAPGVTARRQLLVQDRDDALSILFEFISAQNPVALVNDQLDRLVELVKRRERSARGPADELERLADAVVAASRLLNKAVPSKRRASELLTAA